MFKINDDKDVIICSGVLNSAYRLTNDDETKKNVINFTPDDLKKVFDAITAFKGSGDDYTPTWYKKKEYIILRSVYSFEFKLADDTVVDFDGFCERGLIKGAEIRVKMKQKKGAVYPVAVKVIKDGEMYDAFDDMND